MCAKAFHRLLLLAVLLPGLLARWANIIAPPPAVDEKSVLRVEA